MPLARVQTTMRISRLVSSARIGNYPGGIWAALGIQAVRSTGFSISFTYLPLYLYEQRHISMTVVGTLFLVSGLIAGFSEILGGMLADRFGHRKTFVLIQVSETILFAAIALLIGADSPPWTIFVTATLVTIAGHMSSPAISAIVADVSHSSRLTESYGLMAIGGNLGWAIGPLTGGYLQSVTSYAWVFGIGAIVNAASLIALPKLPRDDYVKAGQAVSGKSLVDFLADRVLFIFCVICTLFYLEMTQWGSTLSVFTVDRVGFTAQQYGLLMSISGALIIAFQYPVSRWIESIGFRTALFLGSFLYGAGFLSFAWVRSFLSAVGSIAVLVAGEMLFVPASYAVIGRISRPEDRAKSMGLLGLCAAVGSSCGPLVGGVLLDSFQTQPLLVWGPVSLPAFVAALGFVFWRGYKRAGPAGERKEMAETASTAGQTET